MSTCRYSNSDLQQIILHDSDLLRLISTFKEQNTTFHGAEFHSGGGYVYDEDGNQYILYFGMDGKGEDQHYFSIGKASRTFSQDEYRLWTNLLIKSSTINSLRKTLDDNEKESKKSWWKKLWS